MCTPSRLRATHPLSSQEGASSGVEKQDILLFPSTVYRASDLFSSILSAKAIVSRHLNSMERVLVYF